MIFHGRGASNITYSTTTLPLVFPPNDVWETTAEIPYLWRVTSQIWRHQYGISALVSQTSFGGKTSGIVAKCRLFSQATPPASSKNMHDLCLQFSLVLKSSRDQGATETEDKTRAKFFGGRLTVLTPELRANGDLLWRTGALSIENVLVPKIA